MDFFDNRYYYINKFFLKCIGQWPYQNTLQKRLIQSAIILVLLINILTMVTGFFRVWGNLDDMAECLPTMFTAFASLIYMIIFILKEEKLKRLFDEIKFDWRLWTSEQEYQILLNYANHGRSYSILYAVCISGTIGIYMLMAISPQILDIILPLDQSRTKRLPYQVYYFINYSDDYFYWIMSHILFNAIVEMYIFIACESILGVFTRHVCGLFDKINHQLRSLNYINGKNRKHKRDISYRTVTFCIEQHNRALEFCDILGSLYCSCFLFILGLNTIVLSASLIQVVVNVDNFEIAVRFGAFTALSIAHLFLCTNPVQNVINYSVGLADNIYNGMWYQMPVNIKKLLLLMMLRSNVPCKITAGKMMEMSLKSVCTILQASFSYFTLFSSMRS